MIRLAAAAAVLTAAAFLPVTSALTPGPAEPDGPAWAPCSSHYDPGPCVWHDPENQSYLMDERGRRVALSPGRALELLTGTPLTPGTFTP